MKYRGPGVIEYLSSICHEETIKVVYTFEVGFKDSLSVPSGVFSRAYIRHLFGRSNDVQQVVKGGKGGSSSTHTENNPVVTRGLEM